MKRKREPLAIRELHRIREAMFAEEKRGGSARYWAEANCLGEEFARKHGLKLVRAKSAALVRERPAKYGR